MKKDKKTLIISTAAIILLIMIVIGATYAYFKAQTGNGANVPTQVTTNTTDSLVFETGSSIAITADTTSFAEGMDNRVGTSFAKATLKANNKTNSASGNYYVYLDVTKNELTYTTEDKKPELLLKITNPSSTEITAGIEGLEYKTVTDGKGNEVSGFDITESRGLLTIANNKEITATKETIENWGVEVILVNLDADQSANGGKEFVGKLQIQKEEIEFTLADYVKRAYTSQGVNGLYMHDETLENGAGDNSIRYAGANPNNYVCFGSTATPCPNDNMYRIIGVFGDQVKLIKADFATVAQLGTTEKGGDYKKSSYLNYKGSLTTIPTYYWSGSSSNQANNWLNSTLNTNALNTVFANNLGSTWMSKIATTTWKVGGNTGANILQQKAKTVYTNEITNPAEGTTESKKIGLMYISDYMYAASPTYWTKVGYNYNNETMDYRAAINDNWLYSGVTEWTISSQSDYTDHAFTVHDSGSLGNGSVNGDGVYAINGVRPSFYLESTVAMTGGNGTAGNPYRVN